MAVLAGMALSTGCSVATRMLARSGQSETSAGTGSARGSAAAPAALPDDGVTEDTHRAFVGQIVFAPHEIPREQPDAARFVSEFYADELIYGRAYLPHSLANELVYVAGSDRPQRNTGRGYEVRLSVDGKRTTGLLERGAVRRDRAGNTTLQVWPRPAPTDGATSTTWKDLVDGLTPGAHEIRIELWARDGSFEARAPIAAGTLTLHKTSDTRVGVGRTFADLEAGMTDAALARTLHDLVTAYAKRERWRESIPGVTIESREWTKVFREHTRIVVARRISVWAHLAGPDGACGAQRIVLEQPVSVRGEHGELFVRGPGDRITLDCATVSAGPDRWAGRTRTQPRPSHTPRLAVRTPVEAAPPAAPPPPSTSPEQRATPVQDVVVTRPAASARGARRISLGVGAATNAADATGVASYANVGIHLRRFELGVGATWPLNALGYLRVAAIRGRFEVAPMVSVSALAESGMTTTVAISGGLSFAYALWNGPVTAGVRVDALVSYNPTPGELALPILGSTYVRF